MNSGSYAGCSSVRIIVGSKSPVPPTLSNSGGFHLEDDQFVDRIGEKIERLTGRKIELRIDHLDASKLQVEFDRDIPLVVLGNNVIQYSGFARMCIEYAAASIQSQRPIDVLEFHVLLARN